MIRPRKKRAMMTQYDDDDDDDGSSALGPGSEIDSDESETEEYPGDDGETPAQAGIIEHLSLKNFMCHDSFELS